MRPVGAEVSGSESVVSFDAFYSAHFVPLYRSMVMLSGSPSDAEDVTREAFVRILERWDSVSRMEAPTAYLFRTAVNLERNRLRRAWRRLRKEAGERDVQKDFSQSIAERTDVLRALRKLSRPQREAIVLVDLLGMTSEEAGGVASVSAHALRARLHRARAVMRKELMGDE